MSTDQTLKSALEAEGSNDQLNHISEETQNFTKGEIEKILSGASHGKHSVGAVNDLAKLSRMRLKNGQHVLPWSQMDVEHPEGTGSTAGGTW